ncbi:hypothetical protein P154DRAFT_533815 [Amniculicola lignicola CBS 123094]|uniref:Peptidase M43 pregnancy-associated plasma-A domain-containing protein n=1 Tax=Amniculicola lignicola CBS 123094 TaxID=1392246 RepID=A0A6A5WIA4_9PLEO|nr:hypothetical protein P154DRAFT_533815 [Amniculicola lignicola CBS 123094]
MKFSALLLPALLPTAFAASCGYEYPGFDPFNATSAESRRSLNSIDKRQTYEIGIFFHLMVKSAPPAGYDAGVRSQVAYLNRNFAPWGFTFALQGITVTVNPVWAQDIGTDLPAKMHALHRGGYDMLNIFVPEGAGGGQCTLPLASSNPVNQDQLDLDGCFVPMNVATSANAGTVAHETGHWLSLLHVWDGGCTPLGDGCTDTSPQTQPSYGRMSRPNDLNSCPAGSQCTAGVFDNVNNFMDYTDCSHEFTSCQGNRMRDAWIRYRKNRAWVPGTIIH